MRESEQQKYFGAHQHKTDLARSETFIIKKSKDAFAWLYGRGRNMGLLLPSEADRLKLTCSISWQMMALLKKSMCSHTMPWGKKVETTPPSQVSSNRGERERK